MLRVTLEKLVAMLEEAVGETVTIGQLAESTGIHRNIISRILNDPDSRSSTTHLDKIIEFFYQHLRPHSSLSDPDLVQSILVNLFEFFPETGEQEVFLNSLARAGGWANIPVGVLWEFFRLSRGKGAEGQGSLEAEWERSERTRRSLAAGARRPKPKPE
jgi:hypothetical protein